MNFLTSKKWAYSACDRPKHVSNLLFCTFIIFSFQKIRISIGIKLKVQNIVKSLHVAGKKMILSSQNLLWRKTRCSRSRQRYSRNDRTGLKENIERDIPKLTVPQLIKYWGYPVFSGLQTSFSNQFICNLGIWSSNQVPRVHSGRCWLRCLDGQQLRHLILKESHNS